MYTGLTIEDITTTPREGDEWHFNYVTKTLLMYRNGTRLKICSVSNPNGDDKLTIDERDLVLILGYLPLLTGGLTASKQTATFTDPNETSVITVWKIVHMSTSPL